jgi:predicted AAA+ superfamily ATPase
MNLAETLEMSPNPSKSLMLIQEKARVSRLQFLQYLERGGMPGIFAVRDNTEREALLQDWLDLTTQRDASLIPKLKVDIDLCRRILEQIAVLEEPDASNIAKALKKDLRRVKTHLLVLQTLFVIHPLPPHPLGTGKVLYFLCDVSFVKILGGSFETQLYTWLVQEQMSQRAYRDDRNTTLYHYRTAKGSRIHLLVEDRTSKQLAAVKLLSEEKTNTKDLEILRALNKKKPTGFEVSLSALGSGRFSFPADKIELYPWEAVC